MSRVAAIGEETRVVGYATAGVLTLAAAGPDEARRAWDDLPGDVACVLLTPAARAALGARLGERPDLVWTVLPA